MNGIEKIVQRIQAESQAEIDRILDAACKEADELLERARAQAEAEKADLTARNEKAAAEREERLVSVAQMEARQVKLAAKQELVDKAYELALKKLCDMPNEDYISVVVALLVKAAPDGRGEVIFAPADRTRIGKKAVEQANQILNGELTRSVETRPIWGGFILKKGNVEVNGAFETLVRLQRAETAGAVAKTLFPEE